MAPNHIRLVNVEEDEESMTAPPAAEEAQENLRMIRELMERSTKYSTFSGLSGVLVGLIAIAGCAVQAFVLPRYWPEHPVRGFLINWILVVALALLVDFVLTKRRAPLVGKHIRSRLGKQMILAAAPGLGIGVLTTIVLIPWLMDFVYPAWMLCYGAAVCAVGIFSQREVRRLGWSFLVTGAVTLLLLRFTDLWPYIWERSYLGLGMTALSFGGFHIIYGLVMWRRGGW
jgi:predicted lysophospholipase L1 biosynthesis ABC-type transport system permease subunit